MCSDDVATEQTETAELREYLEALLRNVAQGNEENVALAVAHFFEEVSIHDLAEQRGLTPKSVEGRLRRLLEKAHDFLEKSHRSKS
jgi:DNA-directed RNA polymerase specialized sigma24 family protein